MVSWEIGRCVFRAAKALESIAGSLEYLVKEHKKQVAYARRPKNG